MSHNFPYVTILIATYNYEQYIGNAIESIISQDYPTEKIQVVVIDDGSVDDTKNVVYRYQERISLIYKYQINQGKAAATQRGIELATGEFLFVLDADDYYLPNCISQVIESFKQSIEIVQVSHLANRLEVKENKFIPQFCTHNLVNKPFDGENMIFKNLFYNYNIGLGSTYACRSKCFKLFTIPPEVDMYVDYYLFLKIAPQGKIVQLDSVLSVFRRHESAYSEGQVKFEDKRRRTLRYFESARALYLGMIHDKLNPLIIKHLELFYLQHLLLASKFLNINKFKTKIKITFILFNLFFYAKNRLTFLKINTKTLFK